MNHVIHNNEDWPSDGSESSAKEKKNISDKKLRRE